MIDAMFQNAVYLSRVPGRYISAGIYTLNSPNLSKHSFPRYQACLSGSSQRPTECKQMNQITLIGFKLLIVL